ncbi:peptidase inhibitor family I36 protein [Kitasatospora atroaurantiaca]|uniref:Peptidase inhibitor family I36 n=1 Tax=Kitasatospora atroaurantiaca TaxID=285545 RepID=A0A561EZ36_9ACTN|nr:peptidase inhibitor family I36 protein [Kitasatospora atroaurantiaca]TWE20871.1 peptidase inhibitor family I36 [Kitasatospora atroaurantiaca]
MLATRHRLTFRLTTLLLSVLTACGLGLAGAATAGATELNGKSESGEFCVYGGPNTTYQILDLYLSRGDFSQLSWPLYGGSPNDRNESYWNLDSYTWHVYTDSNRGGRHGWIDPGVSSNASSTFWHQVSSAYYTAS